MTQRYTVPRYRPTRCHDCGVWAYSPACPLCKTERPLFGLLRLRSDQAKRKAAAEAVQIANVVKLRIKRKV